MTISCACINVGDYDGDDNFYKLNGRTVTARKVHKCYECGKPIEIGAQFLFEQLWNEGTIDTYKTCLTCLSIRNVLFCNGFCYGGLFEYLYSHLDNGDCGVDESCISVLTPAARDVVCGMIEECWERYFDEEDDEK